MVVEYNGYEIIGDGSFGMKSIKTIGRGSLPKSLRGCFSDLREAKKAIDGVRNERELNGRSTKAVSTD